MDGDLHTALSRFVLEHQREAVVVLDRNGHVVDANRSARAVELDIAALFDTPEHDPRIEAFLEELAASGRAFTLVASSTGSVFRLEGTVVHDLVVVVARELSRDPGGDSILGPVAASLIHDFNNLLAPILLFASRLARELDDGTEKAMMASEIKTSAAVAAALARDVLALARPRMIHVECIDINELLLASERLIRRLAGSNVEVLFALSREELAARVDRKALEHAVLTLVTHAHERMPEGGHLAISTALVEHGNDRRVAIALTDTGVAAKSEMSTTEIDGFDVQTQATQGRGTNVTIHLQASMTETRSSAPASTGDVIMLAESDERLGRAITGVLRDRGFTVVSVRARNDAVDAAAVHPVRVAILDSTILRHEPATFLQELRAKKPGLRFVVLSDHACSAITQSRVVVLSKPFGDDELVRAVLDAMG